MKYEDIEALLKSFQGCTFASMDNITNVILKGGKKNELQGRVTKRTSNNQVMLFTNEKSNGYENMVKRRLESEGKDPSQFTVGSLPWGTRVKDSPFIEHKGKYYLQVIFNKPGVSEYFLDGELIDPSQIEGLPEKKEPTEENGQGLTNENAVIVRTFAIDSIESIRVLGGKHKLIVYKYTKVFYIHDNTLMEIIMNNQTNGNKNKKSMNVANIMKMPYFRYGIFTIHEKLPLEDIDNRSYFRGRHFAILFKEYPYKNGEPTEKAIEKFKQFYKEKAII